MDNWITQFMESFGYLGILLMIAIENLFPPIPSEVVLTFGGFMTTYTHMTILGVVVVATIGSIIGAIILYALGRWLGIKRLEKIIDRWGHILKIKKDDLHKANGWFEKYGYWTVLFCRMVPLIRSLISIPAGISNMNFVLFLLYTTIGTLIWNIILVTIGAIVGDRWESIVQFMDVYSTITYILIGIAFIALILYFFTRKRKA